MTPKRSCSGRRSALFVAISTFLACQGALAQTAPPEDTAPQQDAEATTLDSVVVSSQYIPEPLLQSSAVISVVTRQDLQRGGDDNAAQALTRVSGLSVADGKYVFVRGLNERYSSAQLNGSPLPSPEPLKRVVPLDLFPANVLQGADVQKTYSARYPGEFGGGVINLQPLTVPEAPFLTVSVSGGGNSETTSLPGLTHYGSDTDFFGYDDGTRKVTGALAEAMASRRRIDSGQFSDDQLKAIARSFVNAPLNLLQQTDDIPGDVKLEASAGHSVAFGEQGRVGVVAVAGLRNSWRSKDGVQQEGLLEGDALAVKTDYAYLASENNATVNGLLGLGYRNGKHSLGFTTMYVHDTSKETRSREGYDDLAGRQVRDDSTYWYERELVNSQLSGSHAFGEYGDVVLEWRGSHATASRDAPYEKGIRYEKTASGWYEHDGSQQQNYTRFSNVEDRVDSLGVDLAWTLPTERSIVLRGGVAALDNDRSAISREFRFLALNGALPANARLQRVDYLLSNFTTDSGLLTLRETTGSDGAAAYDAYLETRAAYLEAEAQLLENLRASVGLRHEDATQAVVPIDLFGDAPVTGADPLRNDYLLPALSATWTFGNNMQLRFGASRTIARPQFRELAPQQYLDIDSDRVLIGNPYLVDSELLNLDLRYEWYFGEAQYLTAGLFLKDIDRPVEAVVNEAGATVQQTFLNAPRATLHGVELDYKRVFPLRGWLGGGRAVLGANYTWSSSRVEVEADDVTFPLGSNGQPRPAAELVRDGSRMQGQSEHLANLQFGWEQPETGSQAMLLVGYGSERIAARGRPTQPDILFDPGTMLDFVARKGMRWGDTRVTLGFEARNLLGEDYREYQVLGDSALDINRYALGQSYSLSLTVAF